MATNKKGFTLVETLLYTAGLVLMLLVISTILLYMYSWYQTVTISPRVDLVGVNLVDKMVKDIHSAGTINTGLSSFNTTNGSLTITSTINSISTTTDYFISNGYMAYTINSGSTTYLTPNNMTVTRLYLVHATTTKSSAVKFDFDISFKTKQGTTTKTYGGFAILQQSYE